MYRILYLQVPKKKITKKLNYICYPANGVFSSVYFITIQICIVCFPVLNLSFLGPGINTVADLKHTDVSSPNKRGRQILS